MCHSGALCDERHILLEWPALGDLRSQYAPLIAESSGVMAQLVWADDQPLVSKYIIACLDRSEIGVVLVPTMSCPCQSLN